MDSMIPTECPTVMVIGIHFVEKDPDKSSVYRPT